MLGSQPDLLNQKPTFQRHVQQTDMHGKAGTALVWREVPLTLRTSIFSQKFTLPPLGAFQSLAARECQALVKALTVFSSQAGTAQPRQPSRKQGGAPRGGGESGLPQPVTLNTAESLIKIRPAAGEASLRVPCLPGTGVRCENLGSLLRGSAPPALIVYD